MLTPALRKIVFEKLETSNRNDRIGRLIDLGLLLLISITILSVILETVDWINVKYAGLFLIIEFISVGIFTLEYLARVWSSIENPAYKTAKYPRLSYMISPLALIDLIAILPFFLGFIIQIDLRFLRVMRLLRIFKLTRYSPAVSLLLQALREEAGALFAGFLILLVLLILASSGAYLVEHKVQPEDFGSIPAAMWWAMAALTTIGYGDVVPITVAGKFFGSIIAVIGIGMAALPAGILASGLAYQLRRKREQMQTRLRLVLEDGTIDHQEEEALDNFRKDLGLGKSIADEIRADFLATRARQSESTPNARHACPHCGKNLHNDNTSP